MARSLVSQNRKLLRGFAVHPKRDSPRDPRGLKMRFEKIHTHEAICEIEELGAIFSEPVKSASAFSHMVGCRLMECHAKIKADFDVAVVDRSP